MNSPAKSTQLTDAESWVHVGVHLAILLYVFYKTVYQWLVYRFALTHIEHWLLLDSIISYSVMYE